MRIIIVVSSFNQGTREFGKIWERCLNNGTMRARINDHTIRIGDGQEWNIYVFNGVWYFDNRNQESNMIKELGTDIMAVLNECSVASSIAILFHGEKSDFNGLKGQISKSLNNMAIVYLEYHGRSDIFEKYIQPFGDCDKQEEELFENLWRKLEKKSPEDLEQKARTLRYEILSPLVALDLLKQAEGNNTLDENDNLTELRGNIRAAIDDLEGPIEEFCKVPIKCDEFEERLRELMKPEYRSSWEKYHKDLENVAEQMETQIAAIEP